MTNFWQALESVNMTQTEHDLEYRLYYDPENGDPLFYTGTDEPGTYVVVDKKTYDVSNYHCRVEAGKILNLIETGKYKKLVPACNVTTTTTHKDNVMIVTETGSFWNLKTYED